MEDVVANSQVVLEPEGLEDHSVPNWKRQA